MNIETVKSIGTFVILLLAQALVLNHIHLFNCATPLLYVYMVLHFQRNAPKWSLLLWSFLMGLLVDVFSNTPGVAAGSMTFIGFIQPYLWNFLHLVTVLMTLCLHARLLEEDPFSTTV